MALISIVTITFNDHEGLSNTSKFIDTNEVEWIVVDGSKDPKTRIKNKEFLRNKNTKFIQEPDNGRFDAMNKGLALATGKIICFLNGGDRFAENSVTKQVAESYLSSQWKWAVGDTIAVNQQGQKLWTWPMPKHNSMKLIFGVNSYCHQATFIETELMRNLCGFDSDSLYSDWIVSLKLCRLRKPFILNFQTTLFLADGISSQQSIDYWRSESVRLRKRHKLCFLGMPFLDKFLQWCAAKFILSTRGRLIRPDLVEKYP